MAIDGVKIIDSDSGYDIYNNITERYKDGEDIEKIRQDWLNEEANFCIDELFAEIYWTAFAYSLWKIGYPKDEVRTKALQLIEQGATPLWNEIDSKAQKQRQKALDKLKLQLQEDNPKPLVKPAPKKPKTPYFEVGDVLAITIDERYGICFVSAVEVTPRKIEYHLAPTRYLAPTYPTMTDFLQSEVACGKNNQDFALKTDCWFNHKDLGAILPSLKKIGTVQLKPYSLWTLSPAHSIEDIYEKIIEDKKYFGGKLIIPLLVFHLIAFAAKKVADKSIPSLLENLLALGIMVYNIAVGIFLFRCVRPIIPYWELDLIEWYPVPLFFAFFILVFNILFLLRYRNKLYENVLFVLSLGLLLFTLYEFVVTKPFKQQDGAEFLLDKTLLEHAPLLNFIINIAVSLSFILFIRYKRKSNL